MNITAGHGAPAGQDQQRPGRPRQAALRRLVLGERTAEPGIGLAGLSPYPRIRALGYLAGLGVLLWASVSSLDLRSSGPGLGALASLTVAGLGWLAWIWADLRDGRLRPVALAVMGVAGGAVASFGPAGLVFVGISASASAVAFDLPAAVALAAAGPAGFLVAAPGHEAFPGRLLLVAAIDLAGLVAGAGRRQLVQRARQATLVATARERADVARREAELVGERNRLGREMHDVLAHTLGALSIQLTALDTLVRTGAGRDQLHAEISRSRQLVGEGLDEARQAVRALREDSAPLPNQLTRLSGQHGGGFEVTGSPRPVPAEVSLALYRVAQEALTNAAKHAPGALVTVRLAFDPGTVTVSVRNDVPAAQARTPLAATGGGYGLPGMQERIRLAGGQCQAGPTADGGWLVTASVPA